MTSTFKEEVTIPKAVYDSLIKDHLELTALHNGGVDNWEWYYESMVAAGLADDGEEEEEDDV